ncbi:MAG TPA: 3-phosphoshikimate 1-carboxyvinyltransferase [Clostridiales bacterium]|nr:3-phosphoshikimate 1-carboxyvinyltransferase [Clostridiales bacterium]
MDVTVIPSPLSGVISAIPSKSHVHRMLICAALGDKPVTLNLKGTSEDIEATIRCLSALGAKINRYATSLNIEPIVPDISAPPLLDCGESGSTLRFLIPVAAALGCGARFTGSGRLPQRPLEPLLTQLEEHGAVFSSRRLPFNVSGRLKGGVFSLPGDISSQYLTGILLTLPLIGGGQVRLLTPLQSKGYVDMTLSVMSRFGVTVIEEKDMYIIPPESKYTSTKELTAEGDWSNSAFWLCAGALSGPVTVEGLDMDSTQGDRAVADILRDFGADVKVSPGAVTVSSAPLRGIEIDAGEIPDLIPVLSVVAAAAGGTTRIYNARRLRLKESDRLSAIADTLARLGAKVSEKEDELIICGGKRFIGGRVLGFNDHRMVMSAAVAALFSDEPVTISGWRAVEKSYPGFFEDFITLGGIANV